METFRERQASLVAKFEKDKAQKPPHERDVIVELAPEATGRPDYNFRIRGATKFFVEAKAPSVALDATSLPPSAERDKIEREIAITDEKIDEIVYGLYGITDEERRMVEGK